jgi:hypothetical protein
MLVDVGFQSDQKTALDQRGPLVAREPLRDQEINPLFPQIDVLTEVVRLLDRFGRNDVQVGHGNLGINH